MAVLFLFSTAAAHAKSLPAELRSRVETVLKGKRLTAGFCAAWGREQVGYRLNVRFPMMSVFKVHAALAVLHKINNPDTLIHIGRAQIREHTYSPMRKDFPQGDVDLSVRRLIDYAVSQSDNNACDILISLAGGVDSIDKYIRQTTGVEDFAVGETEASMHADLQRVWNNWSTPAAMTRLLGTIYKTVPRESPLLQAMLNTSTGRDKMPAAIAGTPWRLYHKTGSSDRINGIKTADNDCGIFVLPATGQTVVLSVFIKESAESDATNAAVIAGITRAVLEYIAGNK